MSDNQVSWEAKYYKLEEAIKNAAIDCGVYDPKKLEALSQSAAMVTAINKTKRPGRQIGTVIITRGVV
jgi:hypothetical protein